MFKVGHKSIRKVTNSIQVVSVTKIEPPITTNLSYLEYVGRCIVKIIFFPCRKIVLSNNEEKNYIFLLKKELLQFLEVESLLDTTLTYRLPHLQTMCYHMCLEQNQEPPAYISLNWFYLHLKVTHTLN